MEIILKGWASQNDYNIAVLKGETMQVTLILEHPSYHGFGSEGC